MFSKRAVKEYASQLVYMGKVCFQQLDEEEARVMASHIIESTPLIHSYDYVSEADHKTELPYMLAKYMQTQNKDLGQSILELLCRNATIQASNEIDQVLAEKEQDYKEERKYNPENI